MMNTLMLSIFPDQLLNGEREGGSQAALMPDGIIQAIPAACVILHLHVIALGKRQNCGIIIPLSMS